MSTFALKLRNHISIEVIVCLICINIIFLTNNAFANDTFVYDNGHAVYPIGTDDVRMISEKVSIIMNSGTATVKCSFIFENIRNKPIEARLGFPTKPDDMIYIEEEQENVMLPLINFRSYIEGEKADVNIRLDKSQKKWMYWYTWDVTFPPKRKITLQNEYSVNLSMSYYHKWIEYILTTGANWKGTIGNAVIEVVYKDNEELLKRTMYICPEGYRVDDNRIVWEFKDFAPKHNVLVFERGHEPIHQIQSAFIETLKTREYDGDIKKYTENDVELKASQLREAIKDFELFFHLVSDSSDPCLKREYINDINERFARLMRNEIFARHGRTFKSEDLKAIFENTDWYKPDPNYSDDMLNETEKKNIQFIIDYEKKMGWR